MCMETPKTFVIAKLADTIKLVFPITALWYRIDKETKEEYVSYTFAAVGPDNKVYFYQKDICVTADSNAAMIDDVWKAMKERFN